MGLIKWIIIAVIFGMIFGLPIIANFTEIPSSSSPEGIGDYINGLVQYSKEVISQINMEK